MQLISLKSCHYSAARKSSGKGQEKYHQATRCPVKLVLMKKYTLFLLLTLYTFGKGAGAQELAFQPGEQIRYTVFYSLVGLYVNAGSATITTAEAKIANKDAYHIVGEGKTHSSYDWIITVKDRFESYVDANTLEPLKFVRHIEEGDYRKHEEIHFDPKANTATTSEGIVKVPDQVQDLVSSLYYARNIDYNKYRVGEKIGFKLFLDDKIYDMHVRYAGRETIKTRYGTFKAIKLKPLLIKGKVFEGGEKMTIWITDDGNRLPVRVESPLTVGSIKMDLMHYRNLKHPLTSLTKVR